MLTGMLAVRNVFHGENHDLWAVNTEQEYHEEVHDACQTSQTWPDRVT